MMFENIFKTEIELDEYFINDSANDFLYIISSEDLKNKELKPIINKYCVYIIFEENTEKILYVGITNNLVRRLKQHLSGHNREIEYINFKISGFYILSNKALSLMLETHLINKYKPKYNIKKIDNRIYINGFNTKISDDRTHQGEDKKIPSKISKRHKFILRWVR